jgi:hypothetical protein
MGLREDKFGQKSIADVTTLAPTSQKKLIKINYY